MADKYPYTQLPGRLRELLASIPGMGTPDAVTGKWLEQIGYRGGNARTILPVLRFAGVIDKGGKPQEPWKALRRNDKTGKVEFANAIRGAYADLFSTYPDAHRKDAEALRNFFRAQTTAGEGAQGKMVQTFKVLTEFGDFESAAAASPQAPTPAETPAMLQTPAAPIVQLPGGMGGGMTLNVDIQLQLPATSDGEVYEKLFAAMRKHLIDLTGK